MHGPVFVSVPVPCGSGLKFFLLPWVSVVVVVVVSKLFPWSGLPTWFSSVVVVVHVQCPLTLLHTVRLGARGEPSESSILHWVSERGLLRRENEKHGVLLNTEVNQASITMEEFRADVLCACQLLNLHVDIREENFAALQAKTYGMDEKRHLSSYWPRTPPTELDIYFANRRDTYKQIQGRIGPITRNGTL